MEIFIRLNILICLNIYMVFHSIPCYVNFRLCQQKFVCTFLFAKTNTLLVPTLQTKLDVSTTTYTVNHYINIIYKRIKIFVQQCLREKKYKIGQRGILRTTILSQV